MTALAGKGRSSDKTAVLPVPRISVADLLGAQREAVLVHDGADYRLRLTSNGKLILTK